jgi:hypothetical protein
MPEPIVAGIFAWRWLFGKRPLLIPAALAELCKGVARLIATPLSSTPSELIAGEIADARGVTSISADGKKDEWPAIELFTFLDSILVSSNTGRKDTSFTFYKIAWDTLNSVQKAGSDLDAYVRYAGLGYTMYILQSSLPHPLSFDEKGRRSKMYDAVLFSFGSPMTFPKLTTLWRDLSAMTRFWTLMVADKANCKRLEADSSETGSYSSRAEPVGVPSGLLHKRALALLLVRDEIARCIAWGNQQGQELVFWGV